MQPDASSGRTDGAAAHPLVELLDCPSETGNLLAGSAACLNFDAGETVFRQGTDSEGLYLVVSGEFVRKAERLRSRLTLGSARAGELLELAATLGGGHHTYTLKALTRGTLLLLPMGALHRAFESYPPLRMRLLEELAREVSRAYRSSSLSRKVSTRRRSNGAAK